MKSQVWTDMINTVNYSGRPAFYCTVEDTISHTLYIGGKYNGINGAPGNCIVKFDGINFDSLASGIDDQFPMATSSDVKSMIMFQNKLYVFGNFAKAGLYYNRWMARWNGSSWDSFDFKAKGPVYCAEVYNNELYVAGAFDSIGGIAANSIAKFDGINWHSLNQPTKGSNIAGIAHFKGKLYMATKTNATSATSIVFYDGNNWTNWLNVSGSLNRVVNGVKVLDTMLYVYGRFNDIGGSNCKGLAAYNGTHWYGIGQGISGGVLESVTNVAKVNGELFITGLFDKIEGYGNSDSNQQQTTNLAKFDGSKWCLISAPFDESVNGLVTFKNNWYAYGAFQKYGVYTINGFVRWDGGSAIIGCSQPVTIFKSSVGINDTKELSNLKIYPNPVKDKLIIRSELSETSTLSYQLTNTLGQIVLSYSSFTSETELNLSEIPKGMYYLTAKSGGRETTFKLIKE